VRPSRTPHLTMSLKNISQQVVIGTINKFIDNQISKTMSRIVVFQD